MRLLFVVIGFLWINLLSAQSVSISPANYDFGKVEFWKNDTAVFVFENKSNREMYFLPTASQKDLWINYPSRAIQPGEKFRLPVYYYTASKGSFFRKFEIFTNLNSIPISLEISGNIVNIASNALTQCPIFSPAEDPSRLDFTQQFQIFNSISSLPVTGVELKLTSKKHQYRTSKSNELGKSKLDMNLGLYNVTIQNGNYQSFDSIVYINRNTGPLVFWLTPIEKPATPTMVFIDTIKPTFYVKAEPTLKEFGPEMVNGKLSSTRFKPNNIVILMDVSGSMKDANKFVMLKRSLGNLINVLREEDQVTILAYNAKVRTVVSTIKVLDPKAIISTIDTVRAGGLTYGAECLSEALSVLNDLYNPSANNQVILATDGMFDFRELKEKELLQLIKKYSNSDRKLSVLGFGTDNTASKFLGKMAIEGKGSFYHISAQTNVEQLLIDEIKSQSIK